MNDTLQSRLYSRLEEGSGQRAITFYDRDGDFSWYTFEQFYSNAESYTAALADLGLRKGDACILVLPSEEFCATLLLAVLLAGAVPILIAPPVLQSKGAFSNLRQIIVRIVHKTKPSIVICEDSMLDQREKLANASKSTRFLFGQDSLAGGLPGTIPPVRPNEDDIAAMQLTSGTTGFPRICVWQQRSILAALDGMSAAMGLEAADVCLNWTPLYHDMGLVNNFLLCLAKGIPLVMLNPKDFVKKPALWLQGLSDTGATMTWSPNFGFAISAQRIRTQELEGVDLGRVRAFWSAAERIHSETMRAFYERFGPYGLRFEALKTNFGCAENIGGATFSDPDGAFIVEHVDRSKFLEEGIAEPINPSINGTKAISIVGVGRPHHKLAVQILSRNGRRLPEGHVGEIALLTPSRMLGFLGDAQATQRSIHGDLLLTGDLGYVRDGELFWVGRARERITIRGKKIDPSDFEPILLQIPDLRAGCFAAFGIDDERLGTQRIVVVTEVRASASRKPAEIAGDIRNRVMSSLGVNVDEVMLVREGTLTKTSSGKRRHRHFREVYQAGKLTDFQWKLPAMLEAGD
ncbi:MAG TPA: AMP-binding protein [Anaerolineales bacterium]|nr:AMP-binding protein [Anaerolineales bacterium]